MGFFFFLILLIFCTQSQLKTNESDIRLLVKTAQRQSLLKGHKLSSRAAPDIAMTTRSGANKGRNAMSIRKQSEMITSGRASRLKKNKKGGAGTERFPGTAIKSEILLQKSGHPA